MKEIFKMKKVLITGGAGSVGRSLTRKILEYDPAAVRLLDISENSIAEVRNEFGEETHMRYLIGDIRDKNRLKLAVEGVDIVIHLAAMKHVYACEYNPFEAIKTNIDGLQNVIDVARDENVEKFIYTSTDKAASPANVMGMTKLLGEKLVSLASYYKGNRRTVFASVRFGNVMGSTGSAVPLFKKQILSGQSITITDNEMTRFVITMDEAVELICKAVELAKGGETFAWKMKTLKVTDLVSAMIDLYGEDKPVKTVVVGKVPGEKIHEEIMSQDEMERTIELDNLHVVFPAVDYLNIVRKYKIEKNTQNPVIISNMGKHMSCSQIKTLLANIVGGL